MLFEAVRKTRARKRPQLDCETDKNCYNGQYCETDSGKCFDLGDAKYNEACERNGGNLIEVPHFIQLSPDYLVSSFDFVFWFHSQGI